MNVTELHEENPLTFIEPIQHDSTETFKPKTWLEQFQQFTGRVHEVNIEPMLME